MKNRKTKLLDKKTKVFLIAEDELILEGWENALSHATDFEVIRFPNKLRTQKFGAIVVVPDIIIVEAAWLNTIKNQNWLIATKTKNRTKAIAVYGDKKEISRSIKKSIDEIIQSGFRSQQLINLIRGLRRDDKNLCMYYAEQLKKTSSGYRNSEKYTELIASILQLTFAPFFSNPQLKISRTAGEKTAYLTFENNSSHPFWSELKKIFGANYIIFSIENAPTVLDRQSWHLREHLSEPVGKIGFLTNRKPPNSSYFMLQVSIYQNDGKIIIMLFDRQIRALLALKAAGVDPTEIIEDIYQELVIAIGEAKK